MNNIIEYAPIVGLVFMFFLQNKLFVTPEQLEKKHRQILSDMDNKFVSLPVYKDFRDTLDIRLNAIDDNLNDVKNYLMGSK